MLRNRSASGRTRSPILSWRSLVLVSGMLLLQVAEAHATIDTVYVDNTKSCPGGPGTTIDSAYCSILTALSHAHGPDKVIAVVSTGKVYRETDTVNLTVSDSGTVGHPFVLMARGTVILDAADTTSNWTAVPNNSTMWRTPVPASVSSALQIFLDGVPYPYVDYPSPGIPANLPVGRCKLVTTADPVHDSVYVNFGSNPNWPTSVNPTGTTGYVSLRNAIIIQSSNVTVQGFTILRSRDNGITLSGPVRNITIANCDIQSSYRQGIVANPQASHHCTIRDNLCSSNGSFGIYIRELNTDFSILRNTCASNWDVLAYNSIPAGRSSVNGIRLGERSTPLPTDTLTILHHNHLLEGNVAHHNQDSGIEIRTNYTTSRYNQSWSNQDHGYDHLYCRNVSHVGDLAWGNNRDGMSFEESSSNLYLRNCVMANNGRDRCRFDPEMEMLKGAFYNFNSDFNVIWRSASESGDTILVNLKNGIQLGPGNSQCGNSNCADVDSCFGTLPRFYAKYGEEGHSRSGQPVYADSSAGNFLPLSTSSVLDAGDSGGNGYTPFDLRGYYRHDAQAKEPNTGRGPITYADIGPYEFDTAETPTVPTITCATGRWDALVSWPSTQYNGDESSRYELFVGGVSYVTGVQAPAGGTNCVHVTGLAECTSYGIHVVISDVNTTYYSTSNTCTPKTRCSGSLVLGCSGSRPLAGAGEGGLSAELDGEALGAQDEPKSLELRIASTGAGRTILYAIPRECAGLPLDLGVFDVAGRRVLTIDHGAGRLGRFSARVDRSRAGLDRAGVYFVHMRVAGQTVRRTLVVW